MYARILMRVLRHPEIPSKIITGAVMSVYVYNPETNDITVIDTNHGMDLPSFKQHTSGNTSNTGMLLRLLDNIPRRLLGRG